MIQDFGELDDWKSNPQDGKEARLASTFGRTSKGGGPFEERQAG